MRHATLKIEKPGEMRVQLTMSMTLDQLREIREGLKATPRYGPTGWLKEAIDDLERGATRAFRYDEPEAPAEPEAQS